MRTFVVFYLLWTIKTVARLLYHHEREWVGDVPEETWRDYRLVAILNHTSLYEFLFAGIVPNRFIKRMAAYGTVPIADKTIRRPIVGRFWKLIAGNVIPITRERDHTWQQVLGSVDPNCMLIILPEGRMKRADGRDQYGRELVVRGGIADLIEALGEGRMLLAYSLGLHHIQVPGQRVPRLFKPVRMRLEELDIATYRARMVERSGGSKSFKKAVTADLTERRDRYCDPDYKGGVPEPF